MNKLRRLIFGLPTPNWVTLPEPTYEEKERAYIRDRIIIQNLKEDELRRIYFEYDKRLAEIEHDWQLWQKAHPKIEKGKVYTMDEINPVLLADIDMQATPERRENDMWGLLCE